jgi:hypothetical protein
MAATEWHRSGGAWVLDTETKHYRVSQVAPNVFIVNRRNKTDGNLTQFGHGHQTLAQAQAWVDNDKE